LAKALHAAESENKTHRSAVTENSGLFNEVGSHGHTAYGQKTGFVASRLLIIKGREKLIELPLADRIIFVIVALHAFYRNTLLVSA